MKFHVVILKIMAEDDMTNKFTDNIKHNRVKCLECGTILESHYRHDYKTCTCPNQTVVDGGTDYLRYGGMDFSKVEPLTEYYTEEEWANILKREQTRDVTIVSAAAYIQLQEMLDNPPEPNEKLKKLLSKKVAANEDEKDSQDPDNISH